MLSFFVSLDGWFDFTLVVAHQLRRMCTHAHTGHCCGRTLTTTKMREVRGNAIRRCCAFKKDNDRHAKQTYFYVAGFAAPEKTAQATCQPVSTTILSSTRLPDKQSVINGHLIVFITDVISVCSDRQSLSFVYWPKKVGKVRWLKKNPSIGR